ncbi:MAG: Gfo/Idh/MocA family oxidoreductase [Pelagibacterales bacterium]|nr:Gfo/Idh/MocA family oxidoreductase [Pelagibacterales bacterium]
MTNIYNVGIVGTGDAASAHYEAIKNNKNFFIKSVYGSNIYRLKKKKKEWKLNSYNSLNEMLKKENLDILLIANENYKHAQVAKKAIKFGLNILIEKPISSSFSKTKELVNLCKKNNIFMGVVMQKRFNSSYIYLKEIIKKSEIGKIISINLNIFMHRDYNYFKKKQWILNKKKVGNGIVMHHAIHLLDILMWIFNQEVNSVYTWSSNKILKMSIEDSFGGWFRFNSGLPVNFIISISADPSLKSSIEFYGTKKSLFVDDNIIREIGSGKLIHSKKDKNKKRHYNYGQYQDVWKNLVESLKNKKKCKIECSNLLKTHLLIDKICNSIK